MAGGVWPVLRVSLIMRGHGSGDVGQGALVWLVGLVVGMGWQRVAVDLL